MDITVTYPDRTYGTGQPSAGYQMRLLLSGTQSWDSLSLDFRFDPEVQSYGSTEKTWGSHVKAASIGMSVEEAEALSHAILYAVQQMKLTSTRVDLVVTQKDKKISVALPPGEKA